MKKELTIDDIIARGHYSKPEVAQVLRWSVRKVERRMADGRLKFKLWSRENQLRIEGVELRKYYYNLH